MKRSEVDRTKLAPMMAKYMSIKDNYEDTLIFFRLGDFYEMFFEDAEIASRELSLTLLEVIHTRGICARTLWALHRCRWDMQKVN